MTAEIGTDHDLESMATAQRCLDHIGPERFAAAIKAIEQYEMYGHEPRQLLGKLYDLFVLIPPVQLK